SGRCPRRSRELSGICTVSWSRAAAARQISSSASDENSSSGRSWAKQRGAVASRATALAIISGARFESRVFTAGAGAGARHERLVVACEPRDDGPRAPLLRAAVGSGDRVLEPALGPLELGGETQGCGVEGREACGRLGSGGIAVGDRTLDQALGGEPRYH